MKELDKNIEKEVQKTLQLPDSIQRVNGNPYLLSRIQEQLSATPQSTPSLQKRIPVAAMIIVLLILNITTIFKSFQKPVSSEESFLTEHLFPLEKQENWYDALN